MDDYEKAMAEMGLERPQHPDFERGAAILRVGSTMTAEEFVATITEHVDQESLSYLATQRGLRILPLASGHVIEVLTTGDVRGLLTTLAATWSEGFLAGCRFGKGDDGDGLTAEEWEAQQEASS